MPIQYYTLCDNGTYNTIFLKYLIKLILYIYMYIYLFIHIGYIGNGLNNLNEILYLGFDVFYFELHTNQNHPIFFFLHSFLSWRGIFLRCGSSYFTFFGNGADGFSDMPEITNNFNWQPIYIAIFIINLYGNLHYLTIIIV